MSSKGDVRGSSDLQTAESQERQGWGDPHTPLFPGRGCISPAAAVSGMGAERLWVPALTVQLSVIFSKAALQSNFQWVNLAGD